MCPRVLLFLMGVLFIYSQDLVAGDVYISELMVETNARVNAQDILSILSTTTSLQVNSTDGSIYTVTLLQNELVAECLITGNDTNCNCSTGYTWSNDVCYNHNCCTETTCTTNVSYITPLCVPKVNVQINGSVKLNSGTWNSMKQLQLQNMLQGLNGLQYQNIIQRSTIAADFTATVSVRLDTKRLQEKVTTLQTNLPAAIWVNTLGMVKILYPNTTVCYESSPKLKCTFKEATDSAGWNLTQMNQRFELNNGNVVQLNNSCITPQYNSCIAITLQKVTGDWNGTYECGFTTGSVRHTATAPLNVALLPDVITIVTNPLIADCQRQPSNVTINILTTIKQTSENYLVWWSYNGAVNNLQINTSYNGSLVYTFNAYIICQVNLTQSLNVTFKNTKEQQKNAQVDIPVIYAGTIVCNENVTDGDIWPKTPAGATVINQTCADGRVGYKSRICIGPAWQPVYYYCISQQLNSLLNDADNFLKGLGATQEKAMNIFQELKNSSTTPSSNNIADITASLNILNYMANASNNVVLQEEVLPDFINGASNLLNKTWNAINTSTLYTMSSTYLQSMEVLVKNIQVNVSQGVNSTNLQLKFCSSGDCDVSMFDVGVNMNKTSGTLKTVAVKNLMHKLKENYNNTVPTSLLLLATLQDNNDSSLHIRLDFPTEQLNETTPTCVYWNTTGEVWSDVGCFLNTSDGNHTICMCNHLTSFSVLMSKGEEEPRTLENKILDIITNVGLAVSICSLLIFLTVESLVWSAVVKTNLSHFRHTAMVNIATFLLLAHISYLASTSPDVLPNNWCLILTICKHLFFLAMFCWMLCLSVMLVHQLVFVFSPLRKRVFMIFSSIVGYVCPIFIVGSSYVYYKYTNSRYYDKKKCWLVFDGLLAGSIHTFIIPVGTIILTNLFFMVVIIATLVKSKIPESNKADDKETTKSILKVVVFLTPVFGITWMIGFFQLTVDQNNTMYNAVQFSFTVLNSFQGFFIFLTGCFAEQKVREELSRILMAKSKGKSGSTKSLISATYTKEK